MTFRNLLTILALTAVITCRVKAQDVYYAEPDVKDLSRSNFDVIGKLEDRVFILKSPGGPGSQAYNANSYALHVYNDQMKLAGKVNLPLPGVVLSTGTITCKNYFYLFYQCQKNDVVYCMAARFNANGNLVAAPTMIDSTVITKNSSNPLYAIANSDDKSKIMFYRPGIADGNVFGISTILVDSSLNVMKESAVSFDAPYPVDALSNFQLANNGTFMFTALTSRAKDAANNSLTIMLKQPGDNNMAASYVNTDSFSLKDVYVKIDNANNRFLLTGFKATRKGGNINGLYSSVWNLSQLNELHHTITPLTQDLINVEEKVAGKFPENNYRIRNVVLRNDGGFVVITEAVEAIPASISINSSGPSYISSPIEHYLARAGMSSSQNVIDFSSVSAGTPVAANTANDYIAYYGNLVVFSLNDKAVTEWVRAIPKSLPLKNANNYIAGYTVVNAGDNLNFFFNKHEKGKVVLYQRMLSGKGDLSESLPVRNLDFKYSLMPRFARQVGGGQLLIPFSYRNQVSFASMMF